MKFLITGANGLLAQKIIKQIQETQGQFLATSLGGNRNPEVSSLDYQSLDITNDIEVNKVVLAYKPDVVINTAAMTNVDRCEKELEACYAINTKAVGFLADASFAVGAQFIHLSTDFIFDGKAGPYKETDTPNPLSIYGKSKLDAEILLQTHKVKSAVVRTMVVYGKGHNLSRNNIILWLYDSLSQGKKINLVNDQFRAPAWADDLAWACLKIAQLKVDGVYNISGPETLAINTIGLRMARYFNFDEDLINTIDSVGLSAPAERPPKTGFVLEKAIADLGFKPHNLEQTFERLFPSREKL